MSAPKINLTITGTSPAQLATIEDVEGQVNGAFAQQQVQIDGVGQVASTATATADAARETAEAAEAGVAVAQQMVEAARDAAIVGASGIFATAAAGLAATSSGGTFVVADVNGWQLFEDDGGVASPLSGVFPTLDALAPVVASAVPWVQTYVDDDGALIAPRLQWRRGQGDAFLNGRVVDFSSVSTDHGDGSFSLTDAVTRLESGATVIFVFDDDGHSGAATGAFVSMTANPANLAGEIAAYAQSAINGSGVLGYVAANRQPSALDQDILTRYGAGVGAMIVAANGPAKYLLDDGGVVIGGAPAAYQVPTEFGIGRRIHPPSVYTLTNANVRAVYIYSGALTEAQTRELMAREIALPAPAVPATEFPEWLCVIPQDDGSVKTPSLQTHQSTGQAWYNGAVRKIGDVLTNGGAFPCVAKYPPRGITSTSGVTIFEDHTFDDYATHAAVPSGSPVFACNVTAGSPGVGDRIQWDLMTTNNSGPNIVNPGGLDRVQMYLDAAGNYADFTTGARPASVPAALSAIGRRRGQGVMRYGLSIPAVGAVTMQVDAYPAQVGALTLSSFSPPDYFAFGQGYNGANTLANAAMNDVIVFSEALDVDDMSFVGRFNEYGAPPLYVTGDSFNALMAVADGMRLHFKEMGYSYIPILSDGLGGRGVNFHKELAQAWVAQHPDVADYIPVLSEGGFDLTSLGLDNVTTVGPMSRRDIIGHITDFFGAFKDGRGVYLEGHTNNQYNPSSTADIDRFRSYMADIAATFPEFYTPTNARLQAQAVSDADYEAFRVDGRTPDAMRLPNDTIHLSWGAAHDGSAGMYWWSLCAVERLLAQGYLR